MVFDWSFDQGAFYLKGRWAWMCMGLRDGLVDLFLDLG